MGSVPNPHPGGDDGELAEGTEPEPDCSGPPGGNNPEWWMIGPDRYYATFGRAQNGKKDWDYAREHCRRDSTGTGVRLAIPYSRDDVHFMKHIQEAQAWVGKLFVTS